MWLNCTIHADLDSKLEALSVHQSPQAPSRAAGEKGCTYIQQQGCAQGWFWQLYTITKCLQPIAISGFQTAQVGLES